jgi:hypothetical protein
MCNKRYSLWAHRKSYETWTSRGDSLLHELDEMVCKSFMTLFLHTWFHEFITHITCFMSLLHTLHTCKSFMSFHLLHTWFLKHSESLLHRRKFFLCVPCQDAVQVSVQLACVCVCVCVLSTLGNKEGQNCKEKKSSFFTRLHLYENVFMKQNLSLFSPSFASW